TGTISLDPTKSPRQMDVKEGNELIEHGIYEIKGDTLRLYFVAAKVERPTEFKTKEGEEGWLCTYERVKVELGPKRKAQKFEGELEPNSNQGGEGHLTGYKAVVPLALK